jgi:hypothetical protein
MEIHDIYLDSLQDVTAVQYENHVGENLASRAASGCFFIKKSEEQLLQHAGKHYIHLLCNQLLLMLCKELQVVVPSKATNKILVALLLRHLGFSEEHIANMLKLMPDRAKSHEEELDEKDARPVEKEVGGEDGSDQDDGSEDAVPRKKVVKCKDIDLSECTKQLEPPNGCKLYLNAQGGLNPQWVGVLPVGETWEGQHTFTRAFNPITMGTSPDPGKCLTNKKGSPATMHEVHAKGAVHTWLWQWHAASTSKGASSSSKGGPGPSKKQKT